MRRIINVILIMLFISISLCMFACKDNGNKDYTASIEESDVAKLSLFAFDGEGEQKWGLMNLGHAWVTIENVSTSPIQLNDRTLAVGEIISIGTWSMLDHFGVWYNVESGYVSEYNRYDGRVSATIGLSEDDITKVCQFISSNDKWNFLFNCSKFALNLFDSVASDSEYIEKPLIYTPSYIAGEIRKFDTFETNKEMATISDVGYYDGSTFVAFQWEDNYESV